MDPRCACGGADALFRSDARTSYPDVAPSVAAVLLDPNLVVTMGCIIDDDMKPDPLP